MNKLISSYKSKELRRLRKSIKWWEEYKKMVKEGKDALQEMKKKDKFGVKK